MKCSSCLTDRIPEDFPRDRSKKTGLHSKCRACHSAYQKHKRITDVSYRERCLSRSASYKKNRPQEYALAVRNSTLKKKYGLTVFTYEKMLVDQGGVCYLCHRSDDGFGRRLHVDHCHDTGTVRKLLCQPCNTALGKFNHSPALLRAAALYLETHLSTSSC